MNIISKIKKAIRNNNASSTELKHHLKKTDDIYSMAILQPLMIGYPYLPFNGGALRPICIAYVLNEIVINQRQNILEFGSGLSTIMMARLIKKNKLNTNIITVEHNEEWANILKKYLEDEGLLQFVKIIRVDLREMKTSLGAVSWYDYNEVSNFINKTKFDLIIIDGPPANNPNIKYSRIPALANLNNNFSNDYCLVLDDVNRKGEQELVNFYRERNSNINYSIISGTLGVFRTMNNFNPIPIYY